jgi:hypothetical protein
MERLGLRLVREVNDFSAPLGFRYIAKINMFVRNTEYGFDAFLWTSHPALSGDVMGQQYSLLAMLRHNAVDNVVNQLGLIYGEENQKFSSTVCSALELFPPSNARQYSYFLADSASDADLAGVAQSIAVAVKEDACPFFERYSSLTECAIGLNSSPRANTHFLFNNLERRMYYSIATAHLAGLSEFDLLLEQWTGVCSELLPENTRAGAQKKVSRLLEILEISRA